MPDHKQDILPDSSQALGEEVLDIGRFVTAAVAHRLLVFLVFVLFVAAAVAVAFLYPKTYRAEIVLVPASKSAASSALSSLGSLGNLAGLIGVGGGDANSTVALEKLRSRGFTKRFVEQHKLIETLFPEYEEENLRLWDAYERFDELRNVVSEENGTLVRVMVDWRDPQLAARWANQLVADLNAEIREDVIEESRKKLKYLERESETTSNANLRAAIFGLMEAEIQEIMLASVVEEYAFKIVDPAEPPDIEDFVFPRREMIILAGIVLGILVGMLAAFLKHSRQ
ncbi:MAG: hypothetical protein KJO54_11250 [Gammaproteobacteria bacterium]|nr:hypothetical protein [Gammaproteobacteria bacterium]NNF61706.1 hypothetical protein [Gammaproteobacteria bacterium]NNM21761.1 hypothetical protein [Gammaproteobacteria bacterium]